MFFYQSMDAIDGKQARRTGTSGPLGQLFDHGVDTLNTTLAGLLTLQALGLGRGWWSAVSLLTVYINFYLTTWEEYHTHTLYLGYINGPSDGIVAVCLAYCWTAVKGVKWWQ